VRLRTGGGLQFSQLGLDRLVLHIAAGDDIAFRLHELLLGSSIGSWVGGDVATAAERWSGTDSVRAVGFAADEALLPESQRSFSGHRLLQEVAALPQRLLFFEIGDLAARLATVHADEVELVIFCLRADPALESLVDAGSLALFCTPAINLLRKRLDRIAIGPGAWEFHVVPDRTRPMDFEVHSLDSVVGHGTGQIAQQDFHPLYATWHNASAQAYYVTRREPRLLSPKQQQQGPRSSYIGEEVFISLVDAQHAPYRDELRQLSLRAWVTNRDLPALLPQGTAVGATVWRLDSPGPVNRVDALRGPTRPASRRPRGELGWSLVSHLSLNHQSLVGESPQQAAAALRKLLMLYGAPEDAAWARQVDGVHAVQTQAVVRRLPFKGPLVFGSGIDIALELDEMAFQGTSAFLFASVLEQYFARHAAINSFTQLTLRTPQRGEVMRWKPHPGRRDLL
jgi:type VI secretion system protein ImpG